MYKRHVGEIFSIALKKIADKETAEDLVHDSFISLYRQKESLSVDVSLRAYLYVSLKNKIYNFYRKGITRKQYVEYVQSSVTEVDNSTIAQIDTRELEKQLNDEIERLPQQCKIVFKLSRKEFLTNKEIAFRLNISENTVEQHMRRALRQLRGVFGKYLNVLLICFY